MTASNDSTVTISRPTTPILSQKELLLKCLKKRPWLVILTYRSLNNIECAKRAWQEIAKELNNCRDGVHKSGLEWAKENKSLLKKKNLTIEKNSYSLTSLAQQTLKLKGKEHFTDAKKDPKVSLTDDSQLMNSSQTSKDNPEDNNAHLPVHPDHSDSESRSSVVEEKRVLKPTLEQQEMLVHSLEESPWLVQTKNLLSADSKAAWQKIAKKLNYHRYGVFMSWSKWAQYWVRKKNCVTSKNLAIERETRTSGSAGNISPLTSLDKRILKLIRLGKKSSELTSQHNTAMIKPTPPQLETLVKSVEEKPWLVKTRIPMSADSKAAWQEIANKLNHHKNGAVKSWSEWAQYWVRKISYVSSKNLAIERETRRSDSARNSVVFTSLDERILKLIRDGKKSSKLSLQHNAPVKEPTGKAPTLPQQKMLVECLEEKPWLVQSEARQPEMHAWLAAWQVIAEKLNNHKNGAVRSWKQWVEYLAQRKQYLRKKCLIIKKNRRDGAEDSVFTTSLDQRLLKLISAEHFQVGNTGPELSLQLNAIKELRSTKKQKDTLLECLKERPWLPKVTTHSAVSRTRADAAWQEIAKKINRNGKIKSWKEWERHWNSQKIRTMEKLRLIKENQTGERKETKDRVCLTEADQEVLKMMGVEHSLAGNAGPELSLQAGLFHNREATQSSEDNPKVNEALSQSKVNDPLLECEDDQDLLEPEDIESLSEPKDGGPLLEPEDIAFLSEPKDDESPLQPGNDDNLLQSEDDDSPMQNKDDDPLMEFEVDESPLQPENDDPLVESEVDESPLQPGNDDNLSQYEDDDPPMQSGDDDPLVESEDDESPLQPGNDDNLLQSEDDDPPMQSGDDDPLVESEDDESPLQPGNDDNLSQSEDDDPPMQSGDDDPLVESEDDESPLQPGNDDNLSQSEDDDPPMQSGDDDPLVESEDDESPLQPGNDDNLLQSEDDESLSQPKDDESPLQPGNDNNLSQSEDDDAPMQSEDDDPLVQNKDDTLTQSNNDSLIQNEDDDDEANANTDEQRPKPHPTRRDPRSSATPTRRRRVVARKRRPLPAALAERLMAVEEQRVDNETQLMHVMRTMSDAWLQQTRAIQDLATTLRRHY